MKIVGITINQGEYQGRNYHNVVFHGISEATRENAVGQLVEQVKVNYATLLSQIGTDKTDKHIFGYVGKELGFAYNKYGSVEYVTELK